MILPVLMGANLLLLLLAMALELFGLRQKGHRFVRVVGLLGMSALAWAYASVLFHWFAGMPSRFVHPGILLLLAYIISKEIYELYRR